MEHPLPDYKVGDNVIVDLPTRTIEGTIGYVGETDVRIDTSAQGQSWDNEVINKRQFEDGLRQNEQVTTQPDDTVKTVAIYPAEENRMPYDIVIQTIGSKSPTLDAVEPERSTLELAGNFHITDDDLGVGGPKQKFARNIEAIRTLFKLEEEHRGATAEEQQVLSQYVGWGGLADAFDPNKENWSAEYTHLKELLSEDEYAAARASTLNAHYTSPTVIRGIYDAVERMGFRSGNILEPSMGVGNFFGMLPDTIKSAALKKCRNVWMQQLLAITSWAIPLKLQKRAWPRLLFCERTSLIMPGHARSMMPTAKPGIVRAFWTPTGKKSRCIRPQKLLLMKPD